MKIAGRKTDGAWFRTNAYIKKQSADQAVALSTSIGLIPTIGAAYAALTDLATKTGVSSETVPDSVADWATTLGTIGIPRQVWFGVLSFDTYTKATVDGKTKYTKDHEPAFRAFAVDLRQVMKEHVFGHREISDLGNFVVQNMGNPGGVADATKHT